MLGNDGAQPILDRRGLRMAGQKCRLMVLGSVNQGDGKGPPLGGQADLDNALVPIAGTASYQLILLHTVEQFGHRGLLEEAPPRQTCHLLAGTIKKDRQHPPDRNAYTPGAQFALERIGGSAGSQGQQMRQVVVEEAAV